MGTIQLSMDFLLFINNILLKFIVENKFITWQEKNKAFKCGIKDYTIAIQLGV